MGGSGGWVTNVVVLMMFKNVDVGSDVVFVCFLKRNVLTFSFFGNFCELDFPLKLCNRFVMGVLLLSILLVT